MRATEKWAAVAKGTARPCRRVIARAPAGSPLRLSHPPLADGVAASASGFPPSPRLSASGRVCVVSGPGAASVVVRVRLAS